ncbi:MAG TPA: PIN domain-containing protein [Mycobacteriales bacterium]|jgi:predicted nucleic acid-binding protein|nr:PIN domain-containing protein [Mycobacteriales bacterium]
MPLVLDTTVLIDALRGRPAADRVRELLGAGELLLTTAVNVEEIVRGLRESERPAADSLLTGLRVLPIRRREAERAGRWRREHAQRGITLHQADCLIAAATVGVAGRLATANVKDFPMPELSVEEWPVGR